MSILYKALYNLNDWVVLAMAIVSSIGGIFSIVSIFTENSMRKGMKILLFIICICIFTLMIFAIRLVKVPDVVGDLYIDARNELRECGLGFNVKKNEDQSIVKSQSIKPGEIAKRDTLVELTLENDPEEKEKEKKEIIDELKRKGVRFADVSFSFLDLKAKLMDENNKEQMIVSSEIVSPNIKELKLINEEYEIEFTDYSLINNGHPVYKNSYVMKDIPLGDYWIEIEIEGYERFSKEMLLESEALTSTNLYNCSISFNKIDASALYPYVIRFVDSSYEDKMVYTYEVSYDDGIPHAIQENVNHFFMNARIGDKLFLSVDNSTEKVELCLSEPGEVFIMIRDDGTFCQIDYIEWLNGISK